MKRIMSVILSIAIVIGMFSTFSLTVSAEEYHEEICHNKMYYIEHVGSGKLLDIDDGHLNENGTISFENCESGLYMNVFNNDSYNGTKLIQYHHDGTDAEKFRLHKIKTNDVLSAKWTRKISNDEIAWSENDYGFSMINGTGWNKDTLKSYPTPGHEYLMEIEYLDPKTVGEIIKSKAYVEDAWSEVKKVANGTMTEQAILAALKKLEIKDVPFLGDGLEILEIIFNIEKNKEWNTFLDTVRYDENGRCSGVIVVTYSVVRETTFRSSVKQDILGQKPKTKIELYDKKVFYQWTGDNFSEVRYYTEGLKGTWEYNFK